MSNATSYSVKIAGGSQTSDALGPFVQLGDALTGVGQRFGSDGATLFGLRSNEEIDIVAGDAASLAGTVLPPVRQFYVDPLTASALAPSGSEQAPWPDLNVGLAGIATLHERGELKLATGDRIRVTVKAPFTTTTHDRKKRRAESIARTLLFSTTLVLVMPLIAILGFLLYKAWPALTPSFILENPRNVMTAGGIWAPLVGTFYLVFLSLLAAAPIGILAGVYLNEYARDNWLTRIVNLAVVNLAGVPSIVHALFGVGAFVAFADMGESVLAASCTLAIMTLPVIVTSTKEALASVPRSFREACWNMGASRWQTIRTIVLPNSISGILTGVILQVSRAAGETAPILFTGAAFSVTVADSGWSSFFPYGLYDSCMALSYHLHVLMTQVTGGSAAEIEAGRAIPLEHLQYGTAVVLIGLVLLVNSVSIGLRLYLRARRRW